MTARVVALAGVVIVAAAGCGSDEPSGPQGVVQASADATADAGGARVTLTGSISGSPTDKSELTAEGALDGGKGRMTLNVKSEGRTDTTKLAFDGAVYYVSIPPGGLPGGKQWLRIDVSEFAPGGPQEDLSSFLQFAQSNPFNALGFLRGATEDVEDVGTEDVGGVETTHYKGTAELAKVADEAGELGPVYERLLADAEFTEIPIDVWIDGDGLVRRLVYELPVSAARGGGTATLTLEFSDFGAEVDVAPPPEGDWLDISELSGEEQ